MGRPVIQMAQCGQAQTIVGLIHADIRTRIVAQHTGYGNAGIGCIIAELLAIAVRRIFVLQKPVQERRMRRINPHLKRLQPIAIP